MRSFNRRGFTLLEVLMGLGITSMLFMSIYFFYSGMLRTSKKSEERIELNQHAELQLERIVRELQLAVEFTLLKPDEISFRRAQVSGTDSPDGYEVNMDSSARTFETVTYRRSKAEKGFVFQRIHAMGTPEDLFTVDELDKNIFTGWVIPRGAEESPHEVPDMEVYRADRDVRSHLQRIPLVRIRFRMRLGRDRLDIVTKAFVPPIYSKILQPNWNSGS